MIHKMPRFIFKTLPNEKVKMFLFTPEKQNNIFWQYFKRYFYRNIIPWSKTYSDVHNRNIDLIDQVSEPFLDEIQETRKTIHFQKIIPQDNENLT